MPERKRQCSGVNELPSVAVTTKFLGLCQQYGAERLAVRIVAAGRSAGVAGLPENDDWTAWNADQMRAAVEHLQRKRPAPPRQWTRRRLRAVTWTHWKRARTRFAALRRRGVRLTARY